MKERHKKIIGHCCFCLQDFLALTTITSSVRLERFIKITQQNYIRMFSGLGVAGLPNPDALKLINAIRDQIDGSTPDMVFVLDIVSVRFGGYFTPEIKQELQRYPYLQMLTLNDCGIVSLQNFPHLPALIRLDMVFNSIPSGHLQYLAGSRHLQTLMLGANNIAKLEDLQPLKNMRKLLQLDLLNNPVVKEPGYRAQVFALLPSLSILDTLDRVGKDAYNSSNMQEAVSRIPDNLFDKSVPAPLPPLPPMPAHVDIHMKENRKIKHSLPLKAPLDSIAHKPKSAPADRVNPKSKTLKSGIKPAKLTISTSKSRSSRAGLLFPVGRIRRQLKEVMVGNRVGSGSAVYMAAILEYLTAELLQIAGNDAKNDGKKRITPFAIKRALKTDEDLKKLLENVTIGMLNQ